MASYHDAVMIIIRVYCTYETPYVIKVKLTNACIVYILYIEKKVKNDNWHYSQSLLSVFTFHFNKYLIYALFDSDYSN